MRRGRIFDITEIKSAGVEVEGNLEVQVKKIDSFIYLALRIIAVLFFFIIFMHLKKYFGALLILLFPIPSILATVRMYRFAVAPTAYFVVEKDGIFFKEKYYWNEIESVQIQKYFNGIWTEDMYINLKSGKRITIPLPPSLLTEDTDIIAAFIKTYIGP